jgi:hypothetical protein
LEECSRQRELPALAPENEQFAIMSATEGGSPMSDTVILRGAAVELDSAAGQEFVVDCVRAAEGLITDKELAEIYEISPVDWGNIAKNAALGHAIRAERDRRVRNGTAAREAAAKIFVRAPKVMGQILDDARASPRHRIEASRELRATASGDADRPAEQSERFIIRIDLTAGGGGVETYDQPIKIDANDSDAPKQQKLVEQPKLKAISNERFENDER